MPETVTSTRPPHTWVASLISTIVTLPLAFFALVHVMLSPISCDYCAEAEAHRFDASFPAAWTVFVCGLVVALIALVASWMFSRRRPCGQSRARRARTRHGVRRVGDIHGSGRLALSPRRRTAAARTAAASRDLEQVAKFAHVGADITFDRGLGDGIRGDG